VKISFISCIAIAILSALGCASGAAVRDGEMVEVAEPVAAEATAPPAGEAEPADPVRDLERFSGLYQGAIVYDPGSAELEATIELGVAAGGRLAGTIDMAAFDMVYHPLDDVRVDGREIDFSYRRFSEARGPNALFEFEGRLADDGALVGEFIEHRGRIPFRFERIGDAGSPRPELELRPLTDLGPEGDELRAAFNEHPDRVRLILLLSPT
jgi:hypothetical protein